MHRTVVGPSKPRFSVQEGLRGLSDTAMLTRPMFLRWSTVLRCASRRQEPSTALCEKPTASASVRSKRLVPLPRLHSLPEGQEKSHRNLPTETTAVPKYVIVFAS